MNVQTYQQCVHAWMLTCFGEAITRDRAERNHRFLEEALELVQSLGCTRGEASQLVDYVFARDAGDPGQELGGVSVTLAALANASGMSIADQAERELDRITDPEITARIRAKQAAKPRFSPLPGMLDNGGAGQVTEANTLVFDVNDGRQLLLVSDELVQVKVGQDFYVGQVHYVVREIKRDPKNNLIINVEHP